MSFFAKLIYIQTTDLHKKNRSCLTCQKEKNNTFSSFLANHIFIYSNDIWHLSSIPGNSPTILPVRHQPPYSTSSRRHPSICQRLQLPCLHRKLQPDHPPRTTLHGQSYCPQPRCYFCLVSNHLRYPQHA